MNARTSRGFTAYQPDAPQHYASDSKVRWAEGPRVPKPGASPLDCMADDWVESPTGAI